MVEQYPRCSNNFPLLPFHRKGRLLFGFNLFIGFKQIPYHKTSGVNINLSVKKAVKYLGLSAIKRRNCVFYSLFNNSVVSKIHCVIYDYCIISFCNFINIKPTLFNSIYISLSSSSSSIY